MSEVTYGVPLTEEQRAARHLALTGEPTPPPRGTRKTLQLASDSTLFWVLLALHGALIAGEIYIAWKQGWLNI